MTENVQDENVFKALLVDTEAPAYPRNWSIVGMVWVLVHTFITLYSGEVLALYSSLLFGLALIFTQTAFGVWPQPRPHTITPYYVGFLLLVLLLNHDNGFTVTAYFLLPLLTAVCFSWLVRGKFYIDLTIFLLVLMSLVFQVKGLLLLLGEPETPIHYPVEAYYYIVLLHVLIPYALKSTSIKLKVLRFLYLLPSLVLFFVIARLNHTPLAERYAIPTPNSLVFSFFGDVRFISYVLFVLLAGITILFLFRNRKERLRWKKQGDYRGLLTGGSILALMFITLPALLKEHLTAEYYAYMGLMFGLVFMGRERQIYEDITRHPASRKPTIKDYITETRIALQSIWGFLSALFSKNDLTTQNQKRKILHSEGEFYSPYKNGKPQLVPVVFHMHSNRWEGTFTPEELVKHYCDIGFNGVFITDHNRITVTENPASIIPVYEHGWGPHHHHVLVLDAKERLREDCPFGGKIESRRNTLKRLREVSGLLFLAHPEHRNAWSKEDVLFLDYDGIEIFNKSSDSFTSWDEALKAGLLVWGTAGDDCHDPRSRHQTGKRYLLVDVQAYENPFDENGTLKRDVLMDALEKGSFFSVRHKSRELTRQVPGEFLPIIDNIESSGDLIKIVFDRPVDKVRVFDGGEQSVEIQNCRDVEVTFKKDRSFIRLVVEHEDHVLAFNPFARINKHFSV